jgi:hypothetical protein
MGSTVTIGVRVSTGDRVTIGVTGSTGGTVTSGDIVTTGGEVTTIGVPGVEILQANIMLDRMTSE